MPITVKLDDLLHARRMTLTELAEKVDITLANLSILKTGKAKAMRFSTLEAICQVLECQPGDLLGYQPEDWPVPRLPAEHEGPRFPPESPALSVAPQGAGNSEHARQHPPAGFLRERLIGRVLAKQTLFRQQPR